MKHLFLSLFALLFLAACSSNENRTINEDVAAFIESNPQISVFGSIDAKTILDKAEYKSIDKFGETIDKEMKTIQSILNFDTPIYFAMNGTLDERGNPGVIYAFAEVKNKESLTSNIQKRGFDVDKGTDYNFHESGDVAFGITDKRAVFVIKEGLTDGKKLVEEAIAGLKEDTPDNKVTEILNEKADIVVGIDVEASFLGALEKLKMDEDKKTELTEMLVGSYSKMTISFEKGAIDLKSTNYFSDGLKEWMMFGNNSSKMLSQLGSGRPQAGIIVDFDMKKLQKFMDKYAPNAMSEIGKQGGGQAQMALAFAGEEGLAGLWTGKFGAVMMGSTDADGSFKPEFNYQVGLGKGILTLAKGMLDGMKGNVAKMSLKGNTLTAYSSELYMPGKGGLKLPKGCENFGKKPVSGFVSFDGLDLSSMDLEEGKEFVEMLDYMIFEMDADGAHFYLKSKNNNDNILKQVVDQTLKSLKGNISDVNVDITNS